MILSQSQPHDHRKLVVVSKERHIRHYSKEELEELYEKSLSEESQMAEFKEKNKDDLSWEWFQQDFSLANTTINRNFHFSCHCYTTFMQTNRVQTQIVHIVI